MTRARRNFGRGFFSVWRWWRLAPLLVLCFEAGEPAEVAVARAVPLTAAGARISHPNLESATVGGRAVSVFEFPSPLIRVKGKREDISRRR